MNRGLKFDLIQNFAYALNQPKVTTPVIIKSYEKDWESLLQQNHFIDQIQDSLSCLAMSTFQMIIFLICT